jgi:hypothetical protein
MLQKCPYPNIIEELEEFLKIMENNEVDEEEFYKYLALDFDHEDCAIPFIPARNYSTNVTISSRFHTTLLM